MTLELHSPSPSDFGGEKTRSLTRTASKGVSAMASYTPVFFDLASTLTSPTPTLEHPPRGAPRVLAPLRCPTRKRRLGTHYIIEIALE